MARTKFVHNPEIAKQKQADALTKLELGIQELLKSGDWQKYLRTQSRFHNYSFNNCMLIMAQCPHATRVAGFSKWKQLSRRVKKGEKGIRILAPIVRKLDDDLGDPDANTRTLVGFRTVSVFDISQTEGEDLPQVDTSLSGGDLGLWEALESFSINNGVPVHLEASLSGARGYCQYDDTGKPIKIAVDPMLSPLHKAKTLAHEIGHSLLHSCTEYLGHSTRSEKELEAESVAFVVLDHFGLDTSNYSFSYICSWQQGEDAIANLKASGQRIQQAASQIIDWIEGSFATGA
ncbi:protein of unknown function DUF955 [Thalassoporum mexicanum PCC 7367]|uniref:ArdC-like ssDNA-binding domain-containing protein n=1 Tax=Thalassoporum mexicanum TaxID=3457544 RepID=UPI00029F9820|nr:ArdC-like ssDNA-binding domain-containing protein [Pseudanabaena sp. PCC 7367]AFY71461.1 protein of unknown function DUF955 [Pseudanabaena sp. PCC 7367]